MKTEPYEPKGTRFYSQTLKKQMMLISEGPAAGWLAYKHPDGQWVSYRKATQADHDGAVDEVPGDRQIAAQNPRAEKSDGHEELADDQDNRSEEEAVPVQEVKEQGLAQEIEPDGEDPAHAQGQVLEPPPERAVRVAQGRLESIEHRDRRQQFDRDADETDHGEVGIPERTRDVLHDEEGPEEVYGGREGKPGASKHKR